MQENLMETCIEASGDTVPAYECRDLQDDLIIMTYEKDFYVNIAFLKLLLYFHFPSITIHSFFMCYH